MTVLEMEAKKAYIIRSIANIDSEEVINKLSKVVDTIIPSSLPCQHTIKELKEGLKDFICASENKELVSHEEVEKMFSK